MNLLTSWRQALIAHLEKNLQAGDWTVLAGRRDEPSRDRKLAVVFVPTAFAEDGGDVNFARPPMAVRAWIPRSKQPFDPIPPDPEPLEQLMLDLMTCLEPVQTTLVANLYFRVVQVTPDYDNWGVEARLAGWTLNPATLPLS
jgi:hypothetical protein